MLKKLIHVFSLFLLSSMEWASLSSFSSLFTLHQKLHALYPQLCVVEWVQDNGTQHLSILSSAYSHLKILSKVAIFNESCNDRWIYMCLVQGLPHGGLMASCSSPYILMFLAASVLCYFFSYLFVSQVFFNAASSLHSRSSSSLHSYHCNIPFWPKILKTYQGQTKQFQIWRS